MLCMAAERSFGLPDGWLQPAPAVVVAVLAPLARRRADCLLERAAEPGFRLVADPVGDHRDAVRALGRQSFQVAADDVDEHQFAQGTEHTLSADAWLLRLGQSELDVCRERTARVIADADDSRQRGEQGVVRSRIATQEPADKM